MDATKLWSPDGELITTLLGHSASVWHLAIASDGSFLASVGEDNTLIIWNLPRNTRTLPAPNMAVIGCGITYGKTQLLIANC